MLDRDETIREGATGETGSTETAVEHMEFGRGAGEPDRGQPTGLEEATS